MDKFIAIFANILNQYKMKLLCPINTKYFKFISVDVHSLRWRQVDPESEEWDDERKKNFQSDFLLQDVNGSSMSGFFHIIEYDE